MGNNITLNQYQQECLRTVTGTQDGKSFPMDEKTMHLTWSLALAGEVGELANRTKKVFLHGHPYDQEKIAEELGDILWYVAVYAHDIGLDLAGVAQMNLEKLRERYPNGFNMEDSLNRKR